MRGVEVRAKRTVSAAGALNTTVLASSLLHTHPAYAWEGDFGVDGAGLRSLCAWYSHKAHHATLKAKVGRDSTPPTLQPPPATRAPITPARAPTPWLARAS